MLKIPSSQIINYGLVRKIQVFPDRAKWMQNFQLTNSLVDTQISKYVYRDEVLASDVSDRPWSQLIKHMVSWQVSFS